ncbi:MAG: hypothetical protein ACRC0G_10785 [Fusobacteriaceae bacterium]
MNSYWKYVKAGAFSTIIANLCSSLAEKLFSGYVDSLQSATAYFVFALIIIAIHAFVFKSHYTGSFPVDKKGILTWIKMILTITLMTSITVFIMLFSEIGNWIYAIQIFLTFFIASPILARICKE